MNGYLKKAKTTKVMLHQENNKLIYYFIICVFLIGSCSKYKTYNEQEIHTIRKACITKSISIIGEIDYYKVFAAINDSINAWRRNHIGYYQYMGESKAYLIDSILCFNTKGNKLVVAILQKQLLENGVQDDIWYFYGIKTRAKWYFFEGSELTLPREYYQKDIHTPLTFDKLKQIATSNIYKGYLKKNKKGEWEINDDFFADLTSAAWSTKWQTNTPEQWDSIYLNIVREKWADHRKAEQKAIEDKRKAEIMKRYYDSLNK
jgi:hypothetical protein